MDTNLPLSTPRTADDAVLIGEVLDGWWQALPTARLDALHADGRLLVVRFAGASWYPAWQLESDRRTPRPGVEQISAVLRTRLSDEALVLQWYATPQDALRDRTPAAVLDDPYLDRSATEQTVLGLALERDAVSAAV